MNNNNNKELEPPSSEEAFSTTDLESNDNLTINTSAIDDDATQFTTDTAWTSNLQPPPGSSALGGGAVDEETSVMTGFDTIDVEGDEGIQNTSGYEDEDEEGPVHDQLPSVEEYKTRMAEGATGTATSPSKATLDDNNVDNVELGGGAGGNNNNGDDDEGYVHDQLPTVEEYKASTGTVPQPANSSRINAGASGGWTLCCRALCCVIFLGLIVAAILLPLSLQKDSEGNVGFGGLVSHRKKVVNYLIEAGISSSDDLNKPGTPQYQAAKWIADEDKYHMHLPEYIDQRREVHGHNRFVERYALAVLYFAAGGPRWRFDANFMSNDDICNWHGLTTSATSGSTVFLGVTCMEFEDTTGATDEKQNYARELYLCKYNFC